ncbi:hypothetical protein ACQ4LE_005279 [Meloidogyne hapla]
MSSLGGPSTKDSSAAGASAQCNLGNEELNISVVDKMLLMGKVGSSQTRFSDLEKVHADTIRLEEGVNRSLRAVNRKINFNATNLTKLADEVNVGFATLGSQVDDCVNRLNGFATERTHSKSLSPIRTSPRNKSTPKVNLNDKIFEQPQINLSPEEASANNNSQDEVEDQADDHTLNMLSNEGIPSLEVFSDDNIVALDKWSKKFMERIKVYGARLTEEEKLNRLSIFLDDTPKQIFEELSPVKRTTCEQALKSIREELDSPQRRSLSRQALLICKQDNETVKEFLKRFRPLALATAVDMSGTHRERYLCDLLLERLLPNIAFCMKLLNFTQTNRGFEQLCMDAREVEIMIPGRNNPLFPTANVNEMQEVNQYVSSQGPPLGHFKTLNPINPNRVQPREGWRFNQNRTNERNFQNRPSNQQRSWPRPNQRTTNWNRNPSNDRRWNNRPVCNYCSRVGHFASTCRERLERFNSRQYEGQGSSQSQSNSGQIQNASMLSEILNAIRKMKVGENSNNPSVQNLEVTQKGERVNEVVKKEKESKQSSISSWEGRKSIGPKLLPLTILMVFAMLVPALGFESLPKPQWPMICQMEKQGLLWSLPELTECPKLTPNISHAPISQTRTVYMLNDLEYATDAWACRKIRKTIKKYTSITNVPIVEPVSSEMLDVSRDECNRMIKEKKCSLGSLKEENEVFTTGNKIDVSPKMWFIGSFMWTQVQSENCILFEVQVYSHWDEKNIRTPLGGHQNCSYEKGYCVLDDKTFLEWKINNKSFCRYVPIGRWSGKFLDNTWLSDDAQMALHFEKPTPKMEVCGKVLEISEQGFATETHMERPKRSPKEESLGLATSPELAARLTYLDKEWAETMTFSFAHSLKAVCDHMETVKKLAVAAYLSNPTGLARMVFSNEYLVAKREGLSLLSVWPCVKLGENDFKFKGTDLDECFDLVPIQFKTNSKEIIAFLDRNTMIIQPTARKAPCSQFSKIIVEVNENALEINQRTGETKIVKPRGIKKNEVRYFQVPNLKSHSFHQLVLVNLTDLNTHTFMTNMAKVSELTYRLDQKDTIITKTLSDQWKEAGNKITKEIFGEYMGIWKILVTCLIAVLSIDLAIRWALILSKIYLGNLLEIARPFKAKTKERQESVKTPRKVKSVPLRRKSTIKTRKRSTRKKSSWIPQVSQIPTMEIDVLTIANENAASAHSKSNINAVSPNTAITRVLVNSKPVNCLIDTGASISIAPISLARELNIGLTPTCLAITSASGHEILVKAQMKCCLEVAGLKHTVDVNLVEDKQLNNRRNYQMIIGCDLLGKLPPVTFDFLNGKAWFGNSAVCLGINNQPLIQNANIYAIEATTILPGTHKIVKGKLMSLNSLSNVLVHALDSRLADENIGLIQTVVKPENKQVCV